MIRIRQPDHQDMLPDHQDMLPDHQDMLPDDQEYGQGMTDRHKIKEADPKEILRSASLA